MQHPGLAPRSFSLLADWLPIPLQCFPHWFPILGRRFHDYFFSLLLEKPCGQASQLFGAAAKLAPLKRVFTCDFDVTDDYRQHLFVNVDSRYPIRHSSSRPGAESVLRFLNQGRGLSLVCAGRYNTAQLSAQIRTLRIRQEQGFNFSRQFSASPPRAGAMLADFHEVSRATWLHETGAENSGNGASRNEQTKTAKHHLPADTQVR